jgi:hypothetical protein
MSRLHRIANRRRGLGVVTQILSMSAGFESRTIDRGTTRVGHIQQDYLPCEALTFTAFEILTTVNISGNISSKSGYIRAG